MSTDIASIDPDKLERILASLSPEAKRLVLRTIAELQTGNSDTLELMQRALWIRKPPPIDEFVYSKEFLGIPQGTIYPAVQELIYRIDDDAIREVFVCAGKGSGKSSLTTITMARQAHKVAYCMRDPSAFFGVLPDVLIAVLNMSISSSQAEMVIFSKFAALLKGRCFWNNGKPTFQQRKRHIELPNNTHSLSGHSGYQSFFGYDVFCGVLDEFSHFRDTTKRSVSEEVYSGVQGSCKTRFPKHYKIVAISTPLSKECSTYSRIEGARNSGVEPVIVGEDADGGKLNVEVDGDGYAKVLND